MLPQTQNEQIGDAVSGTRIMSSRTYRFNPENGEISGLYDDQTQVMAQAIWKRLLTPRGIYPIYSKEYGSDLWRMNGLPLAYVQVLLPDLIRRALCADERIKSVDQFRFSREQNGLYCHPTAHLKRFFADNVSGDTDRLIKFCIIIKRPALIERTYPL